MEWNIKQIGKTHLMIVKIWKICLNMYGNGADGNDDNDDDFEHISAAEHDVSVTVCRWLNTFII